MSILSQVTKGRLQQPFLGLIYGVDGVGKTSLAADAPSPIFLGTENGTSFLNVARLPEPKTFAEALDQIRALINEEHEYKTLAIDSVDWLEPLVWTQVCADNNWKHIEDPGYGKGFTAALNEWVKFVALVKELRDKRKMHVVLIGHSTMKAYNDPTNNSTYDRYILKLNEKCAAKLREFVDFVFFMNFEVVTSKDENKKTRAFSDGKRLCFTERRPAYDAKSRVSMPSEIEIPPQRAWDAVMSHVLKAESDETAAQIKANIEAMMLQVKNEELKTKVTGLMQRAGDSADAMRIIRTKLAEHLAA